MPPVKTAEFVEGVAALTAALRLLSLGLGRGQAALVSYLLFNAAAPLVLISLSTSSPVYFWSFIAYAIMNWIVGFRAVREMFTLSMSDYPGIRTAARWALWAITGLAALACIALTASSWGAGRNGRSNLFYVEVADRSFLFTMAAVAAGLVFFLSRYPLHLLRNTYVSCGFFSAVLLCEAAADLVDSVSSHLFSNDVDVAAALLCGVFYAGWALLLKPETAVASGRISFEKPDENHLLGELEAMNRLLGRVGRR